MINPKDVKLIIFDLDGTIFQSDDANFEVIKRALSQLNLDYQVSKEDVKKYMGEPSEKFYKNVLPLDRHQLWEEVRNKVREEYESCLKDFGRVFPEAVETLQILRKRGYILALFSNSSVEYFNTAISVLNIKDYFDYVESNQENNLTKIELVRKIKNTFPDLEAAVIGDRIHDIEAAKENNALSIGVLYGYGGKEPEQANISINEFSTLLEIFDRKLPIFEKILEEIESRKQPDRAFVVGITGIDVSGKTQFAKSLEKFLSSKNLRTQVINLDDFHNPQKVRYSGENQAENY